MLSSAGLVARSGVAALSLSAAAAMAGCGRADAGDGPKAVDRLPEGPGLAARHLGDRGLTGDPAVLLAEDFESGAISDLGKRWTEVNNRDGKPLSFVEDAAPGSAGKRSLEITATFGHDSGGHLFAPLARGVDLAFARFYVKFPKDAGYVHHFVWMGGLNPQTRWPNPQAGVRPAGPDRFSVGIEPWGRNGKVAPPGVWAFYVYWPEMKISADGKYWGNGLSPVEEPVVPRDRWQCVEFMIRLNTRPDSRDGELALWLDGKLAADFKAGVPRGPWSGMGFRLLERGGEPFEGLLWRTDPALKVSNFWLEHYVTERSLRSNGVEKPPPENRVRFDDIVVATEYIGPIAPK